MLSLAMLPSCSPIMLISREKASQTGAKLHGGHLAKITSCFGCGNVMTYMGVFRCSSPFVSTEICAEETGSFEAKLARSLPQFDQTSSVTGIQSFIHELEAIKVSGHLP